jgi:hypothetical protein
MPGALVVDEMGLGKTFTSVEAAMHYKLVTEKVVMGLPLSMLWGNTLGQWVNMVQIYFPGIVSEDREWFLVDRVNSVPYYRLEMQTAPSHGHPAPGLTFEPILVVTMAGVAVTFKMVTDKVTHGTYLKLVNLIHADNGNVTHEDLDTSIDQPENRWNIHLVPYDNFTC